MSNIEFLTIQDEHEKRKESLDLDPSFSSIQVGETGSNLIISETGGKFDFNDKDIVIKSALGLPTGPTLFHEAASKAYVDNQAGANAGTGLAKESGTLSLTAPLSFLNDVNDSVGSSTGVLLYNDGSEWNEASLADLSNGNVAGVSGILLQDIKDVTGTLNSITGNVLISSGDSWINAEPSVMAQGAFGSSGISLENLKNVAAPVSSDRVLYFNGTTWTARVLSTITNGDFGDTGLSIADIRDVNDDAVNNAATGSILIWDGTEFIERLFSNAVGDSAFGINIDDLKNVGNTVSGTTGTLLTYNGTNWVSKDPEDIAGGVFGKGIEIRDLLDVTGTNMPADSLLSFNGSWFARSDTDFVSRVSDTTLASGVNITLDGDGEILGLPNTPTTDNSATSKIYVDSVAAGLDPKASVRAITTTGLNAEYDPGVTGVGATLTQSTGVSLPYEFGIDDAVDSVTGWAVDQRVLVKDQTDTIQNGIYKVTTVGSPSTKWVLTRTEDFDGTPDNEVDGGEHTFANEGANFKDTGWVASRPNGAIIVGATGIEFTQFSAAGQFQAGNGLGKTGLTFFLDANPSQLNNLGETGAILTDIGAGYTGVKLYDLTNENISGITGVGIQDLKDVDNWGTTSTGVLLAYNGTGWNRFFLHDLSNGQEAGFTGIALKDLREVDDSITHATGLILYDNGVDWTTAALPDFTKGNIAGVSGVAIEDLKNVTGVATDEQVLTFESGKWFPKDASAGGGGGGLVWNATSGSAPIQDEENGELVYLYESGLDQKLTVWLKVPNSYSAGKPINMRIAEYSPSTSNTILLQSTAYLIRKNTDAVTSTTNSRVSTNSALTNTVANQYRETVLDLTDTSGEVNAVAVSAGDLIRVELKRGTDTDTADIRFIPSATEVTFQ